MALIYLILFFSLFLIMQIASIYIPEKVKRVIRACSLGLSFLIAAWLVITGIIRSDLYDAAVGASLGALNLYILWGAR